MPSSDAELKALRRRAAVSLLGMLPKTLGNVYFGSWSWLQQLRRRGANDEDGLVDEMESLLAVVEDEYCNKHLLYSLLELILVRLMPELGVKGVTDLWDERLE